MSVEPTYTYAHPLLTYLTVVFTAVKAGPASYTGTITFDYATGGEVFDITIVRVLPAPWRPLDKFTESLEWKTSIISARNAETRAALRENPRATYDYDFLLTGGVDINTFRAVAEDPSTPVLTPLWYNEYQVGAISSGAVSITVPTADSEFAVDDYVFIVDDSNQSEFLLVLTIVGDVITFDGTVANNYTDATAIPARLMTIKKTSYREFNRDLYKGSFSLLNYDDTSRPIQIYLQYDGMDILEDASIIKQSVNASINRVGKMTDNGTGLVRFKAIENRARNVLDHSWKSVGFAEIHEMKNWLYSRLGRQKKFLIPTFQNDFYLAAPYAGGTSMDVLTTHFTAPFYFQIVTNSDVVYHKKCTSLVSSGGVDTLTIDAVGVALAATDIKTFSIMTTSRYASDSFEITYKNYQTAELNTTTTSI